MMAYHQYDYGSRYTTIECNSHEVRFSSLESKISDLTNLVIEIGSRNTSSVGKFGTNTQCVNPMDAPPTFHYITEPVYTYGGFPSPSQDPFSLVLKHLLSVMATPSKSKRVRVRMAR